MMTSFVVNSAADADTFGNPLGDLNRNDGVCDADPGPAQVCTLRAAIEQANSNHNPGQQDTILIGPARIAPQSPLPTITEPVSIQPASGTASRVVLDGTMAGPGTTGLTITAGRSDLQGLHILGFSGNGIELQGAGQNSVRGSYIGSILPHGIVRGNAGSGIAIINSSENTIGGLLPRDANVISGNLNGINILGPGSSRNVVLGNYIGTDPSGSLDVGNLAGIVINDAPFNAIGADSIGGRNIISGNERVGVLIQGSDAVGNEVLGNYIGTDKHGSRDLGNGGEGVFILDAPANVVGGRRPGTGYRPSFEGRNVISGNDGDGVRIQGIGAQNNWVYGNYIGVDRNGTQPLSNRGHGVVISEASHNQIGGSRVPLRNVISANDFSGILISGQAATGNWVVGNYVGTDASGIVDLGNANDGISINRAQKNLIGGRPGEGNLVSGNENNGINISGKGNRVEGNFVGTDVTGTVALGNAQNGVLIVEAASNAIGAPYRTNVISANGGDGILIVGKLSIGNTVQANHIGTDRNGVVAMGNGGSGVHIVLNASFNTIGGAVAEASNIIAFNGQNSTQTAHGVFVVGGNGNSVYRNSIHSNSGLGIELGNDFVTPNDVYDVDSGSNNFQNYPEPIDISRGCRLPPAGPAGIGQACPTVPPETLQTVTGSMQAQANTTYQIQFYASDRADAMGHGEGHRFIRERTVRTDVNGKAHFVEVFDVSDRYLTATATDGDGNTSEFSLNWILGDFNRNGDIDPEDVDKVFAAMRQTNPDSKYDLTLDGVIDQNDVRYMVEDRLNTRFGDSNLDGNVDFTDFTALAQRFGQAGGWADGDFNGDGQVDFADFIILANGFGYQR